MKTPQLKVLEIKAIRIEQIGILEENEDRKKKRKKDENDDA